MSGGGSSAPSSQNVTNTTIPEYARPYVESALGKTAALTDVNQNPYQPYKGEQVAQFTPMQNQAFQNVGNQQIAPQIADASNIAYQTGQYGLGTQGTAAQLQNASLGYGAMAAGAGDRYAQQATNPYASQAYMNPYLQASLQPALQEVQRQYDITGTQQMGNASRSGAFGGSREALMAAENQRNKNLAMNQMIGQGYTTAFDKASQAQQFGANLGLQGLQGGQQGVQGAVGAGQYGLQGLGQAGASAGTLGQLGQTQFGQEQAANQAMMTAGGQQQALQQKGLDVARQEYTDQLNYPYKQLAFQSDMFRGVPLSQASQSVYQNTGNMVPQLLGAGIAAYGASAGRSAKEGGLMSYARGGAVQGYAMGGQPVVDPRAVAATSPVALSSKLAQLSDGQLQAYARTVKDAVALAEVKAEMARRAGVRQPQGEEPTQTVAESVAGQGGIAEQPVMAAGGGIVALAGGSKDATEDDTFGSDVRLEDVKEKKPSLEGMFGLRGAKVPRSQVIPAPANDKTMANWDASGREIARDTELFAERQGVAQDQQARQIPELANWDASGREIARDTELFAERQAMAQDQQNRADTAAQMYAGNAQEGPGQYPNLGGITAIPPVAGATPAVPVATGAPVGGGITSAGPSAPAATPAGGAPAGGINAITPRTAGAGGHGATVGSTGAGVPVGVPGDPMNFATYRANVEDMAKLDPEDKATLANMQARAEKRLRRAEGQEKNVMNDAFIAGGLAMMGGLNLADGIRRAAEQGGKQYFSSQAEARKAIDKAEEAQDAFYQYRTALKQGNKKLANEMYGTFYKSYTDYISRITSAGITAGASLENAKATREATEAWRKDQTEQRGFDRDERIRQFDLSLKQNENQFLTRMKELNNQQAITSFEQLDRTFKDTMAAKDAAQAKVFAEFKPRFERFTLMDPAKMSDADKKQYNALNTEYKAAMLSKLTPWDDQLEQVQNRKAAMMGIRPIGSKSGTSSPFKVVGVE